MNLKFIVLLLILWGELARSQPDYPQNYFIPPLDIPLNVSGTFGELRKNHFHSGIDFKTQQKEGFNVYAVGEGYVSRIKITTFGYGKAIYITHPNGYTSVYAHLMKATGAIEEYIKKAQYRDKRFEVELFPKSGEIPVKQGEVIGISGNTGSSGGPHLHFEFRDSTTERIINPLFFGLDKKVTDSQKPDIMGVMVYPVSEDAVVNKSQRPIMMDLVSQKDGSFLAGKVTARGIIGFAVNTYDKQNGNYNKNGVYKIETFCNGKKNFSMTFDVFSFDESRYINAYIDYPRMKKTGQWFQRLFYTSLFPLSMRSEQLNGLLEIKPGFVINYRIEVSDFHGNKRTVYVPVHYGEEPIVVKKEDKRTPYLVSAKKDNMYMKDDISVFIPADTFYEDFYLDFDVKDGVLYLHDDTIPLHGAVTITFEKPNIVSEEDRKRTFIAVANGNNWTYNKTYHKSNGTMTIYPKSMGVFKMVTDKEPPVVRPLNFTEGKWMSTQSTIQVTISDELSGIQSYEGYFNGKWALFEYDSKSKTLTHDFSDGIVEEGRNDFKLIVTDNVGNSTIFETHFFRSQKL